MNTRTQSARAGTRRADARSVVPLAAAALLLATNAAAVDAAGPAAPDAAAAPAVPATASPPSSAPGDATPRATPSTPPSPEPTPVATVSRPNDDRECDDESAAEGYGAFLLGAGSFDFSSVNDRLTANGYEKLPSLRTLLGGEGHAVFESGFVAGAKGGAILGGGANGAGGMRARLSGGFGMLDFGFALVHTKPILLTLTGGVGGYGTSLEISDGQSITFDAALKDPRRSVSLGQGGVLVGLTIGLDGRVPVGRVEHHRQGFFTLGARVGVLYGPQLGGWGLPGGAQAADGPTTGLAGVYGALAIGFGGGRAR